MSGEEAPGPRSVDPEAAQRLRALFTTDTPRVYRRPRALLALLVLVPLLLVVSQPLPWHHDIVPGDGYHVVYGYTRSYWLPIIGVIVLGVCARVAARPVTVPVVVALIVVAGVTMIGVYADWANSYAQAGSLHLDPYNGPGFFLAVAALAGLVIAAGVAWYERATSASL